MGKNGSSPLNHRNINGPAFKGLDVLSKQVIWDKCAVTIVIKIIMVC